MGVKTDIVTTLKSSECASISFTFASISINGSMYRTIADRIDSGAIQLVQSQNLPSTRARYFYEHDTIAVGSQPQADLIVHEATHAIQDVNRMVSHFTTAKPLLM